MNKKGFFSNLVAFILFLILYLMSCSSSEEKTQQTLQVFAATGLGNVAPEIFLDFEEQHNIKIKINFASSGILATQISKGAQFDLFLSANWQWIDSLAQKNLIFPSSAQAVAATSLVIIAPLNKQVDKIIFSDDFDIKSKIERHITIGDPSYVPAGKYAKEVLDRLKWSESLKSKIVLAQSVSAALRYVELGQCDLGIVYKSQAKSSKKVKIVAQIPENLHSPVLFYMAKSSKSLQTEALQQLTIFLQNQGQKHFIKEGFSTLNNKTSGI